MTAQPSSERSPSLVLWLLGLAGIGLLVAGALHVLHVTPIDEGQQHQLVWRLARLQLTGAMAGTSSLPQTSGPGFGLFAAPLYLPIHSLLSQVDAFRAVSVLCLVPLGVATIAASRALGVPARGGRELLDVAAVVLGIPVLACFSEYFHPADVLATAAVLGAFAAMARGRTTWTWLLLGFAVTTRQWAVIPIAVLAILAERGDRVRLVAGSLVTATVLTLPFLLADPRRTLDALLANEVVRGWLTAPSLLPLGGGGLYVLSRIVPLLLVMVWCWWLDRSGAVFSPELAMAALAVALLVRPLIDPAGYLYYLAPGYACAVLLRPRSWRWPIIGLLGGAVLWYRRSVRGRWPAFWLDENGRHPLVSGSALSVITSLLLLAAVVAVVARTLALLDAQGEALDPGDGGSAEAAPGGPGDAERGDRVLG